MNHCHSHTHIDPKLPEEPIADQFSCPMHPNIVKDLPGLCPECGMALIGVKGQKVHKVESQHFDKHAGHSTNIFKNKFWLSFVLTVPIVASRWFGVEAPMWLILTLASVIFFYGGWIFVASAYRELKARLPGMMTLIALAISVAYVYSVYAVFSGAGENLFWELSTLITIMLLGHWIEMRAVSGAQGALKELSKLLPDEAEIMRDDGTVHKVSLAEVKVRDRALVRPGGKIPADGKIEDGASQVDESVATGESKPVSKKIGDEVIAGTTNGDGALTVRVTKIGGNTFLAGVMRLVAEAQASKSRLQILSDRAAFYLTLIAIGAGGLTFVGWWLASDAVTAIGFTVAVLVVACPHALGLAIPLVASISTTKAARNGFLVRNRLALESARNVDTVLFDKTGTLTSGAYGVMSAGDDTLRLAASVDALSEHFVAKAIVAEAKKRGLALLSVTDFTRVPGKGVRGMIDGSEVRVEGTESEGAETTVAVTRDGGLVGKITLADTVRSESKEAVRSLQEAGVSVAMLTGDSEKVAEWVAESIGIKEYFARVLPHQKSEKVKMLQGQGKRVIMVGDGVNDAPALTQADVGIAIGAGTNVAIESAGIILVRNDPRDIAKIIHLSRLTYSKMIQNLFWAAGYNIVAIPLAAGVLAYRGIVLEPAMAAALMSVSTVIVALNAVLLKNKEL